MKYVLAVLPLLLAACAPATTPADPHTGPVPLANDRAQPVLALFEHVLGDYFTAGSTSLPTTCATLRPVPLNPQQEEALILRFVRLAPAARCRVQGSGTTDTITNQPATVVQVYDFTCADADHCTGWALQPGQPATRYALRYEAGAWRFASDRRILAE